ncbi:MAG: hypothetical protein M1836_006212 [Candelina mexicana]|nr:MAG: hypothetical protein M1836_006212 [Candelina mexicana]
MVLISINTWKNNLRHKYQNVPPEELYYGVPQDRAAHLLYVSWISLFFIYISLWFSKAAFIAFYYDLFSYQSRKLRIMLWATSVFTACTFLLHILLLFLWCHPVSLNWNISSHLCSAVHSITSVTISTFTNIFTDLLILLIPLTLLTTLLRSSSPLELSALLFVITIGGLSITAALARFVTLKAVQHAPKAEITHTIDVWALVEIVASLVAVCLPSLRTFVRRREERVRSRESSRGTSPGVSGRRKGGEKSVVSLEGTSITDLV